jgi:hypothetical protein
MVLRLRNQFAITPLGSTEFLCLFILYKWLTDCFFAYKGSVNNWKRQGIDEKKYHEKHRVVT